MKDQGEKKNREWLILLLLLPLGVMIMCLAGDIALAQPGTWRVEAEMNSALDPYVAMTSESFGRIEAVRAGIMTAPAWMDSFLTPGVETPITSFDSSTPSISESATASPLATVTLNGSLTPGTTVTATLIPSSTPYPTSTIYYPPPSTATKIKPPAPTKTNTPVPSADLSITKTDGVTTYNPGGSLQYTIVVSNAGPDNETMATVIDNFPAQINTIAWTCTAIGGASCSASGNSNIADTVDLPVGSAATYTVDVTIKDSATGTLTNIATVNSSLSDPNNANNTASDQDTYLPIADLSITKDDSVTTYVAGGSVTYVITVSNAGPNDVTGATVSDIFPSQIASTSWTCAASTGASCTAGGSGNISDTVNIPSGGNVTYTITATIDGVASGTMSNTASVAAPGGIAEPNTANNSATDVDLENTALPSCDVTKDIAVTGPVSLTASQVNCLRFDTSGNPKKISLSGHPNVYVRWDGLEQNLAGSCAVHEKIFNNASETLTQIGINKNAGNEVILYVIAEKSGNIDISLVDSWVGCP